MKKPSSAANLYNVIDNFGEAMEMFTQSDMFTTSPKQKIKKRKKNDKQTVLSKTIDEIENITTSIKDVEIKMKRTSNKDLKKYRVTYCSLQKQLQRINAFLNAELDNDSLSCSTDKE